MAKIYLVIQIKLNQFLKNVHAITDLPTQSVVKHYRSGRHFSEFCLQDGGGNQLA